MEETKARVENAKPVLSPAQQAHKNNAVTAMVLGITSLVLFFMPVLNLAALVVAIVGLCKARKNRAFALANDIKEDSMNTAGYVCSICGIVLSGLSVLFCIFLLIIALFFVGAAVTTLPAMLPEIQNMIPELSDMIGQTAAAISSELL